MDSSHSISNWLGNLVSASAIVGAIAGWLPALAAIVGLIWYLIQIFESATVQRWTAARRTRKIARLKAKVMMMEARSLSLLHDPYHPPKHD